MGPHGTRLSRENYDRVVGEWLQAGRATPKAADAGGASVAELVNAFRKSGAIPDSHAHTYKLVMSIIVRLYGRTAAAEFGPLALKVVRQAMVDAGWNRANVNNRTHMVRRIFRWGVEHELVTADVVAALDAVDALRRGGTAAAESEPVKPVAVAHVEATLTKLSPMVAAMVRLQLLTGMRSGEICVMRTADIDTSGDVWVYRPGQHKTLHRGKSRDVAIGPKAIDVLRPWLRPELDAYVFSPAEAVKAHHAARAAARTTPAGQGNAPGTNRVRKPLRAAGERYTTVTYRRAVYRACDRTWPLPATLRPRKGERLPAWRARLTPQQRAAVADWQASHRWHPHQLRHTFATAVRDRFGLDHVQKALGHSHSAVTERYAKVALEKSAEVARVMG
ncbi:MAG TPA: tyrosine-type recombinase/integrase [Tepidisphaeraceae bacterium]